MDTWPGRASDNLCRHVVLHPKRPKAYLSHLRSRTDVFNARGSIFPELSICTLTPPKADEKRRVAIALDTFNGVYVTANPWESAVSPDGKTFVTVYAGTDDMNYSAVVDDDYQRGRPDRRRCPSASTRGRSATGRTARSCTSTPPSTSA